MLKKKTEEKKPRIANSAKNVIYIEYVFQKSKYWVNGPSKTNNKHNLYKCIRPLFTQKSKKK